MLPYNGQISQFTLKIDEILKLEKEIKYITDVIAAKSRFSRSQFRTESELSAVTGAPSHIKSSIKYKKTTSKNNLEVLEIEEDVSPSSNFSKNSHNHPVVPHPTGQQEETPVNKTFKYKLSFYHNSLYEDSLDERSFVLDMDHKYNFDRGVVSKGVLENRRKYEAGREMRENMLPSNENLYSPTKRLESIESSNQPMTPNSEDNEFENATVFVDKNGTQAGGVNYEEMGTEELLMDGEGSGADRDRVLRFSEDMSEYDVQQVVTPTKKYSNFSRKKAPSHGKGKSRTPNLGSNQERVKIVGQKLPKASTLKHDPNESRDFKAEAGAFQSSRKIAKVQPQHINILKNTPTESTDGRNQKGQNLTKNRANLLQNNLKDTRRGLLRVTPISANPKKLRHSPSGKSGESVENPWIQDELKMKNLVEQHEKLTKDDNRLVDLLVIIKNNMSEREKRSFETTSNKGDLTSELCSIDEEAGRDIENLTNKILKKRQNILIKKTGFVAGGKGGSSSVADRKQDQLVIKYIRLGIVQRFKEFSYTKIQVLKQFLFLIFLLGVLGLRMAINYMMLEYEAVINQVTLSENIVVPQSFLLKEIYKMKLIEGGFVNQSVFAPVKTPYHMGIYSSMKTSMVKNFRRLRDQEIGSISNKEAEIKMRTRDAVPQILLNINLLTAYSSVLYDYQTLISTYSASQAKFGEVFFFNEETTLSNLYEILVVMAGLSEALVQKYKSLTSDFSLVMYTYLGFTLFMSFLVAVIIGAFSIKINEELSKSAEMLLRIDADLIYIFLERYELIIKKIEIKKMEMQRRLIKTALTMGLTTDKIQTKKINFGNTTGGLGYTKRMQSVVFGSSTGKEKSSLGEESKLSRDLGQHNSHRKGLGANDKIERNDRDSDESLDSEIRKVFNQKNSNSRRRYRNFLKAPGANKGFTVFLLFLATILINVPSIVDFFTQQSSYNTLREYNLGSTSAAFLGSDILTKTAIFYTEMLELYKKDRSDQNGLDSISRRLKASVQARFDSRIILQNLVNQDSNLLKIMDNSICNYLGNTSDHFELCQFALDSEINYDIFLGMNDISNYQATALTSLNATLLSGQQNSELLSHVEFVKKDLLVYFVSEALGKLDDQIHKRIEDIAIERLYQGYLFMGIFPVCLLLYYVCSRLLYSQFVSKKSIERMLHTFQALPSQIMVNSSYLKNYFMVKHSQQFLM